MPDRWGNKDRGSVTAPWWGQCLKNAYRKSPSTPHVDPDNKSRFYHSQCYLTKVKESMGRRRAEETLAASRFVNGLMVPGSKLEGLVLAHWMPNS
jgi:hypothetical protein